MRIEQLTYVAAVTQHGSLRKASEQLHISQPALSEAVSKLERELGVTLLDRRRSGARISRQGQELLSNMVEVLDSVDRLKLAAGEAHVASRAVRIGTVNAATSTLLIPAVHAFGEAVPGTTVEILDLTAADIDQGLAEGTLDLGLVNLLGDEDVAPGLSGTDLLRGRPVVVLPPEHHLCERDAIDVEDLREESFVAMRPGYLMHRVAHRLFGARLPRSCHTTDGAEMGKLMVAEGLGVTILPDYSVLGDPLQRLGLVTTRPLADEATRVRLVLQQRRSDRVPTAVAELRDLLVAGAHTLSASRQTTRGSVSPGDTDPRADLRGGPGQESETGAS